MGSYYALDQDEDHVVANAIAKHYKPLGPGDDVPRDPVSIAVALADKLDTLMGFWAIDEKPTGSKDPYALRRAALGVIRIILENRTRLALTPLIVRGIGNRIAYFIGYRHGAGVGGAATSLREAGLPNEKVEEFLEQFRVASKAEFEAQKSELAEQIVDRSLSLVTFIYERLEGILKDNGYNANVVRAVQSPYAPTFLAGNISEVADYADALGRFLETEDGANLLTGTKRAINILRIEEKKDGRAYDQPPDPSLFHEPQEKALARAVDEVEQAAASAVANEDFEAAMAAMALLRAPVDEFFDTVTVNAAEPELRENRLRLLNRIRATTQKVADFTKIEG
jgi:glycyl-tRNA synthetase beta chain